MIFNRSGHRSPYHILPKYRIAGNSGKFWIGANFCIFRMMACHTKINTTKTTTLLTDVLASKNVKVKIRIQKLILKALRPFIRKFAPSKISHYTVFSFYTYSFLSKSRCSFKLPPVSSSMTIIFYNGSPQKFIFSK